MFSLFKKSRNGFWDKDKLYDLDTGILLAEIYYFQISDTYQICFQEDSGKYHLLSNQYHSLEYAMLASEKFYKIKHVATIGLM